MRRNQNGFTLSETLTTVLLIGIIFSAIAGGTVAVKDAYEQITVKSEAQTLLSTAVTDLSADLHSVTQILTTDSGTYYYCTTRSTAVYYSNDSDLGILVNNSDTSQSVALVTEKTSSSGLITRIKDESITYANGVFTLEVEVVKQKSTDKVVESTELVIRPYADQLGS